MKNILFRPWKGENYGKSELGRLLIVGDSHYFLNNEDESVFENFTIDIIGEAGDYYIKFIDKISEVFNTANPKEFWSKVAFANAIQSAFRSSDQKPNAEDLKTVEPAIQEYLNILKPDKMIVFSKRVWEEGLSSDINWGEYIETIYDEQYDKKATLWKFNYENGTCYAIGVNHPSSIGFNSKEWQLLINKFLEKEC